MLKKHSQFFKSLFLISDLFNLSLIWIIAYILRFYTTFIRPPILGIPDFWIYLKFLPAFLIIWSICSNKMDLYRPRRFDHFIKEIWDLIKCQTISIIFLIALIFIFKQYEFSRLAFIYFWALSIVGLILNRVFIRTLLRSLRKKGYNLRFALIAGTGEIGQKLYEKIELHPELGIEVIGFLSGEREQVGKKIKEIPIIGMYEDIDKILAEKNIDIFFIALPIKEYVYLENLINKIRGNLPDIKVVPGACEFLTLRGGVDELEDLPFVSIQSSPLYGWNIFYKRMFDLSFGILILLLTLPVMLIISLLIKVSSKGPILYVQERVGMDGRVFKMLKFRTMRVDAEKETGPVWAKENDPRRTKIGAILRKTSLDELPQIFNVIKGDMSLVGPRPERPFFVEEFRKKMPFYMLRHKIKAGITGWAQVNGWRGNTSIEKRIEHDLYYIQNWSIAFDLKILIMSLWKGIFSKTAY